MAYEFTKLADVPALEEVPEGANAFIEVEGEIKRVPGDGLGGGGGGGVGGATTFYYRYQGSSYVEIFAGQEDATMTDFDTFIGALAKGIVQLFPHISASSETSYYMPDIAANREVYTAVSEAFGRTLIFSDSELPPVPGG